MSDDRNYMPIVAGTVLAFGAVVLLGRLNNNHQPAAETMTENAKPITTAAMAGFAKTFTTPNISAAAKTTAVRPNSTSRPKTTLSPTRQARLAQLTSEPIVRTAPATAPLQRARSPEYGWPNYDGYADEDNRGQLHYDDDPGPFSHIPGVCSSCGDGGDADGAPLLPMPNQGGIGLSMWFI